MIEFLFLAFFVAMLLPQGHAFVLKLFAIIRNLLGPWVYLGVPLGFLFILGLTFHQLFR